MKKINERKVFNNDEIINRLTDEERYQWYLRIKESLPLLQKTRDVTDLQTAVKDYERRHGIV